MPNPVLAPLFSEEGESVISLSSEPNNWINFQGANSLDYHLGIYYGVSLKPGTPHDSTNITNFLGEAALCYYTEVGENLSADVLLGGGWGSTYVHENGSQPFWYYTQGYHGFKTTESQFVRYFAQLDLGQKADEHIYGGAIRIAYINAYHFIDLSHMGQGNDSSFTDFYFSHPQKTFSIEPVVFWKGLIDGTGDHLFFSAQVGNPIFLSTTFEQFRSMPIGAVGLEYHFR
jgi:hypothetical protein